MENNFENAKAFLKDKMPRHSYGGSARQIEIARCMIDYANVILQSNEFICDHPDEAIIRDKPTDFCLACNKNI
jgi:hypothetical protein